MFRSCTRFTDFTFKTHQNLAEEAEDLNRTCTGSHDFHAGEVCLCFRGGWLGSEGGGGGAMREGGELLRGRLAERAHTRSRIT